jgi:DNA-binding NarL/FixJ family response regulator
VTGQEPIRVVIVDDHAIVRRGVIDLIATCDDITVVGEASDGREALAVVRETTPNVVLMDLSMPDIDGVEATRSICASMSTVQVIVLTSLGDQESILAALDAGAIGYLLKHSEPDTILSAIRVAHEGGSPIDPVAARAMLLNRARSRPAATQSPLTDREREVLLAVRSGLANKQIARALGISERTVKAHLTSVFQRIGVSDRTQAALWAQRQLPPD